MNLSPDRLLRSGQGLWAAYLLQAALELGVFTELGRGPRTLAQLQRRLVLREPPAADLLDALVGLGWLEREGDDRDAVYMNSREAGHYLDARSPASFGRRLHDAFAAAAPATASLVGALRDDATWATVPLPQAVLDAWASLVGDALAQRLPYADTRTVIACGGGALHTACALAAAQPHLQVLVRLPPQEIAAARDHIGVSGLAPRVRAHSVHDADPRADVLVVNRWWPSSADPDTALAAAHCALKAGGRLLWVDHWLDETRRHSAPALMALLRRRLAGDVPHAETVHAAHARCVDAGFTRTECMPLAGGLSVIQAFA